MLTNITVCYIEKTLTIIYDVSCLVLFTVQTVHVYVHRSRSRWYVFPIRKRRFHDYFQLRFHIYHYNRLYVHPTYASIVTM